MKTLKTLFVAASMMLVGAFATLTPSVAADAIVPVGQLVQVENPTLAGVYTGVFAGSSTTGSKGAIVGATLGAKVTDNIDVEGTFDYKENEQQLSGNVLFGQQINNVKPYALAGTGYKWVEDGTDHPFWNVGGGVKVGLSERTELDARYRYSKPYSTSKGSEDHRVTLGVNYKW